MNEYGVLILGGTGQVGAAVVQALLDAPHCAEVVMITRRPVASRGDARLRVVVLDTDKPSFEQEVAALAKSCGPREMFGASCVGIGAGSRKWSEEELTKLEVGVVGAFARGCHTGGIESFGLLTAAGTNSNSLVRYGRVMGRKEEAVQAVGFARLMIFRPGIIAGNVHTPGFVAALGRIIPGPWGTIEQTEIGRAFVREFERRDFSGVKILHNAEMR